MRYSSSAAWSLYMIDVGGGLADPDALDQEQQREQAGDRDRQVDDADRQRRELGHRLSTA